MTVAAPLTFRSFILGPRRYVAATPWQAYQAIPLAALIWGAAQMVAAFVFPKVTGIDIRDLPDFRPGGTGAGNWSAAAVNAFVLLLSS